MARSQAQEDNQNRFRNLNQRALQLAELLKQKEIAKAAKKTKEGKK